MGAPGGFGGGPLARLAGRKVLEPSRQHADRIGQPAHAFLEYLHMLHNE